MRRAGETKMMRNEGWGRTRRYCLCAVSLARKGEVGMENTGQGIGTF